jgi:hypothetical protein
MICQIHKVIWGIIRHLPAKGPVLMITAGAKANSPNIPGKKQIYIPIVTK